MRIFALHRPIFRLVLLVLLLTMAVTAGQTLTTKAQSTGTPVVIEANDQPNQATPSGDQTLRIAGPSDGPQSLDPALSRDLSTAFLVRQIFRGLTRFGPDLQPVPEIARRIDISADGLDYTFTLRDNATFQDGRPITSADAIASLTRSLDPTTVNGDLSLLGGPTFLSDIQGSSDVIAGKTHQVSGLQALDAKTVKIRLDAPRATFLMKLASAPASIVDSNDVSKGPDWWKSPNGTGPFRISEFAPNDHLTLAGFDGYFGGPPALSKVEILLGARSLQPFNLYEANQIDVTGVTVDNVDRVLAPESGLSDQVTVTKLFAVDYIAFRTDTAPFDDPMIRKAIQLAFPRDKIASVSYDNYVSKASGMVPDGMLGRDWHADVTGFDVDAAKKAIAESSYCSADKVPPIRIYVSGYAGAEALRDTVGPELGLDIEVINVDWSDFVVGLSRKEYSAYELYWGADFPDPESMLFTLFGRDQVDNYSDYNNPQFEALLNQAATEQDVEKRASLYQQAQQILADDQVVIPLYYEVSYTLAKPAVKGLQVTALDILGLETVWLEH